MSIRGVWQLTRLTVKYCDIQSGSRGVRDFLREGAAAFAAGHSHIDIHAQVKRGRHPVAIGEYRNGNVLEHSLRDESLHGVEVVLNKLRDNTGRKVKKHAKEVVKRAAWFKKKKPFSKHAFILLAHPLWLSWDGLSYPMDANQY